MFKYATPCCGVNPAMDNGGTFCPSCQKSITPTTPTLKRAIRIKCGWCEREFDWEDDGGFWECPHCGGS